MKTSFLILFFFISLLSSLAWGETWDDLVQREGIYYKKFTDVPFTGSVEGVWPGLSLGGSSVTGHLEKGLPQGVWRFYDDDGQLLSRVTVVDGMLEGISSEYFDSGTLKSSGSYSSDQKVGYWTYYFFNGVVKTRGFYDSDAQSGAWEFFDQTGNLIFVGKQKDWGEVQQSLKKEREREAAETQRQREQARVLKERERQRLLEEQERQREKQREQRLAKLRDAKKAIENHDEDARASEINKQEAAARAAQSLAKDELDKYINAIRAEVLEKWAWDGESVGLAVRYEMRLSESGAVNSIKLAQSSGNPAYDESVRKAIQMASPLMRNDLPDATLFHRYLEDGVIIHFKY